MQYHSFFRNYKFIYWEIGMVDNQIFPSGQ